eukprot:74095_1
MASKSTNASDRTQKASKSTALGAQCSICKQRIDKHKWVMDCCVVGCAIKNVHYPCLVPDQCHLERIDLRYCLRMDWNIEMILLICMMCSACFVKMHKQIDGLKYQYWFNKNEIKMNGMELMAQKTFTDGHQGAFKGYDVKPRAPSITANVTAGQVKIEMMNMGGTPTALLHVPSDVLSNEKAMSILSAMDKFRDKILTQQKKALPTEDRNKYVEFADT